VAAPAVGAAALVAATAATTSGKFVERTTDRPTRSTFFLLSGTNVERRAVCRSGSTLFPG
jgi:hypothetical protein